MIGVYFWDHFALIMGEAGTSGKSFRHTERLLGDAVGERLLVRRVVALDVETKESS